jgi:S1-C subfamily serine protease
MSVDLTAGIVRILKPDGTTAGTRFVVSSDGLIATCSHVVQSEESQLRGDPRPECVDVVFYVHREQRRAKVELGYWRQSDAEDVAILRVEGQLPQEVQALPLGNSAGGQGHNLITFGFPEAKPVEGISGKCEVIGRAASQEYPS